MSEKNQYAVAVMVENLSNGAMDMYLRTVDASSREEAVGLGMDYYQTEGQTTHKVTAIRVRVGSGADQVYIDLIESGKKIGAIKQYRTDTGMGLKDAKAYIDNLEQVHNLRRRR